jgi:hypothetical protein
VINQLRRLLLERGMVFAQRPDPCFPHRTEYDLRIQEGPEGSRGASTPRRR